MITHIAVSPSQIVSSVIWACLTLTVVLVMGPHYARAEIDTAIATSDFLNSIGVSTTGPDRDQPLVKTIEMIRYCGFRWVRAGIEGLSDNGPTTIQTFLDLHRETGVRLSWGLVSGGSDVRKLVETGKVLAKAGALLAFEGNNEPNNWRVTYEGEKGGGRDPSWIAVGICTRLSRATRRLRTILSGRYPNQARREIMSAFSFSRFPPADEP